MTEYSSVMAGGFEVSSNTETAEQMVEALKKPEEKASEPVVIHDGKKHVAPPEEKEKATPAEAGKKGGEATAAIKRKEAREAKPAEPEIDPDEIDEDDEAAVDAALRSAKERHDAKMARVYTAARAKIKAQKVAAKAEAERDAARAELEAVRKPAQTQPEPSRETQATGDDPEPDPEKFTEPKEYVKASGKWAARQELREYHRQQENFQQAAHYEQVFDNAVGTYVSGRDEWFADNPTEVDAVRELEQVLIPSKIALGPLTQDQVIADGAMLATKQDKKNGVRFIHYLATHPDELLGLRSMTDASDILAECRAIVRHLPTVTEASVRPVSVSKASPPVRLPTGSPRSEAPDITSPSLDFDEYVRRRGASAR